MYINWKRKELMITLALYGPSESGKSTTWHYWARSADISPDNGADMFSLRLEHIQSKQLVMNLRDIPGSSDVSRRRVALYGVDGVVFVADSHPSRQEANRLSFQELQTNLQAMRKSLHTMPLLFQYNKRDLPDAVPLDMLQRALNPEALLPYQATSALFEDGVGEVLRQITDLVLIAVM